MTRACGALAGGRPKHVERLYLNRVGDVRELAVLVREEVREAVLGGDELVPGRVKQSIAELGPDLAHQGFGG